MFFPTQDIWKILSNIEYFYIPEYEELINAKFINPFIQKVKHKRLQIIFWGPYFYSLQELESPCMSHATKQDYCRKVLSESPYT